MVLKKSAGLIGEAVRADKAPAPAAARWELIQQSPRTRANLSRSAKRVQGAAGSAADEKSGRYSTPGSGMCSAALSGPADCSPRRKAC
jgi:hypothetical protein